MSGVPTPGTPERRVHDLARAHVAGRSEAQIDTAATSYLAAIVGGGASDSTIAATVHGVLAGIGDVLGRGPVEPPRVESVTPAQPAAWRSEFGGLVTGHCLHNRHAQCGGRGAQIRVDDQLDGPCVCPCHPERVESVALTPDGLAVNP